MEYMGNKEFWDGKFSMRGDKFLHPEKTLVDNIKYFKKGTVLDIACGDGRNSLFLHDEGFKVTSIDFSKVALQRLNSFGEERGYKLHTMEVDLSVSGVLLKFENFDNVVVNHYKLEEKQLRDVELILKPGGILFLSGFGEKHKCNEKIREGDLIRKSDLLCLEKSFELIEFSEEENEIGSFVTYIYCKK